MSTAEAERPELTALTDKQKHRVARQVRTRRGTCSGCRGRDFDIGDALHLGFLFLSEDEDAYIIALTCTNTQCPAPYTGITVRGSEIWLR